MMWTLNPVNEPMMFMFYGENNFYVVVSYEGKCLIIGEARSAERARHHAS